MFFSTRILVITTYFCVEMSKRKKNLPSSEGPVMESSSICGIEPSLISRPEPAIDVLGEEIGTVTTVKVTQTA